MNAKFVYGGILAFVTGFVLWINMANLFGFGIIGQWETLLFEFSVALLMFGGMAYAWKGAEVDRVHGVVVAIVVFIVIALLLFFSLGVFSA
jgi:hypothetical protein